MKLYDKEFDLEKLTYEAEEIFKEFYCNYLAGNIQFLELVAGETCLPFLKAMIELRQKEGWKYRIEELLECSQGIFMGAKIENGKACFTYHFEVQEFDSKVSLKDGSEASSELLGDKGLL
jgi:hypothetical protein